MNGWTSDFPARKTFELRQTEALESIARALTKIAAIADTHPKDGDVKQAPLVSGGGAGTAIAQPLGRNP